MNDQSHALPLPVGDQNILVAEQERRSDDIG